MLGSAGVPTRPAGIPETAHGPTLEYHQLPYGSSTYLIMGTQALSMWQRRRPVMLVDGDTFYTRDIVAQFRSIAPSSGAVFCFLAPHNTPIFSYIKRYWPSSDSPSRLSVTQRALSVTQRALSVTQRALSVT
jgi:glycine/serine hydroxymethyltransferase